MLYEYLHREQTPEEIAKRFPSLTLEHIYATILYYLRNREEVSSYMERWLEFGRHAREEQEHNPSPAVVRLRTAVAARLKVHAEAQM